MKNNHRQQNLRLSQRTISPRPLLAILIGGIFLAEVIAMILVNLFPSWPYLWKVLFDATIMVVIIFPLLYGMVFRPLVQHIQQSDRTERIQGARLRLLEYAHAHTLEELLQNILDEMEALTASKIGFFHFLEADQTSLWLQAWSTNTLKQMCKAEGKNLHYPVDQAGVWADAVRLRQPVIHNDYAHLPNRKGTPAGHAEIQREMVIPILRDQKIVAILGVGNKAQDYTPMDMQILTALGDFAWDIVENKRSESSLRQNEEKFRTLANWTFDWEMWLDPQDQIIYTSPSCERITGYTAEELAADPNSLVRMVHPDDRLDYEEHRRITHDTPSDTTIRLEFRIVGRDGSEHWIEHICRPLYGPGQQHLGRRISNRDITARKLAEQKIREQNLKEERLTRALQSLQLDIARDIHDTLGQNISFLRMNLEHLQEKGWGTPESLHAQLNNMTKAANEAYDLIRAMLAMLQTGYSSDVRELFSRYGRQVAERGDFEFEISCQGKPNPLFPDQIRQIFYIFREALSNIEKHAQAGRVTCELIWEDNSLTFVISDNGRGFARDAAQPAGHYGLNFMRARAELIHGALFVESAPGQGTAIKVIVPNVSEPAATAKEEIL